MTAFSRMELHSEAGLSSSYSGDHAFAAAPGCEADVLFVFTPGMPRFGCLRLLGSVMRGETGPKKIAESSERYDNHYVDSPVWWNALAAS